LLCAAAFVLPAALGGCGAESWTPPAPSGTTWQYEHQGFREHRTNVVAGGVRGPVGLGYGAAFGFRNDSELYGRAEADPFAESSPIDGMKFNEHLAAQGRKLSSPLPAVSAQVPSSPSAQPAPGAQP
jgi:hypothetical protein